MTHYILVIAPMDCVFVGPFESADAATEHAQTISHNTYVMPESDMRANIAEFGDCPIQPPRN